MHASKYLSFLLQLIFAKNSRPVVNVKIMFKIKQHATSFNIEILKNFSVAL